ALVFQSARRARVVDQRQAPAAAEPSPRSGRRLQPLRHQALPPPRPRQSVSPGHLPGGKLRPVSPEGLTLLPPRGALLLPCPSLQLSCRRTVDLHLEVDGGLQRRPS